MTEPPFPPTSTASAGDSRPVLAVITGHLTPYRIHINRRMAREMPGFRIATLVTKNQSTLWKAQEVPEIGTVMFDHTSLDWEQEPWIPHLRHEWEKAGQVREWLESNPVSAVICAGYDEIPNLVAARWCRKRGIPCFVYGDSNIRGRTATGLKLKLKAVIVPRLVRRFRGVMCCGRLGRQFFERYGADPRTIFYVPLEPDYAQIEALSNEQVASACLKHGLAPGRRRMVMCARLVGLKRTDQVVEAFKAIAAERPEWDLVIIGDGPERADAESRVTAGLKERIRFLGSISDMAEIGAIYRASDCLVLASMMDAWALVINEAACAGLAIISSHVVGASAELVRDGVNGAIYQAGDLDGLTRAMRKVTDAAAIDRLRAASPGILADWRREADPVQGVRDALKWAGARGA